MNTRYKRLLGIAVAATTIMPSLRSAPEAGNLDRIRREMKQMQSLDQNKLTLPQNNDLINALQRHTQHVAKNPDVYITLDEEALFNQSGEDAVYENSAIWPQTTLGNRRIHSDAEPIPVLEIIKNAPADFDEDESECSESESEVSETPAVVVVQEQKAAAFLKQPKEVVNLPNDEKKKSSTI